MVHCAIGGGGVGVGVGHSLLTLSCAVRSAVLIYCSIYQCVHSDELTAAMCTCMYISNVLIEIELTRVLV